MATSSLQVEPHATSCYIAAGRKDIKLISVKLAGKQLSSGQYEVTDKHLIIESPPSGNFVLEVEVAVKPKENTSLEGLYNSSGTFCTQCEAEGFRGITYFYDRSTPTTQFGQHDSAALPKDSVHYISCSVS